MDINWDSHLELVPAYCMELFNKEHRYLTAQNAVIDLLEIEGKFDTVIGTGVSGMLIVSEIGEMVGCHWAVVRQPGVRTHAKSSISGHLGKKLIFVDDLIATGDTFEYVKEQVSLITDLHEFETKFVGIYLYNERRLSTNPHKIGRASCRERV